MGDKLQNCWMQFCYQVHQLSLRCQVIQGLTLQKLKGTLADHTTKTAALQNGNNQLTTYFPFQLPGNLTNTLVNFQKTAPNGEKRTQKQKGGRFDSNKGLWIGPNGKPILLFGAQYPTLQYIHELAHWNPNKMMLWGKQYYWKPSFTITQQVYSRCTICLRYNSGKPLRSSQGNFPLPVGPFEIWQIDFIQMRPLSRLPVRTCHGLHVFTLD